MGLLGREGNLVGAFCRVLRHLAHLLDGHAHMLNTLGLLTSSQCDFGNQRIGLTNFGLDLNQ